MSKRFINTTFIAISLLIAGCAGQPKQPLQRKGDVVAQGSGQLSFRSPAAGLVSIYNVNTNSVIHSSAVEPGSVVTVNPGAGNITVTDAARAGTQIVHTGIDKSNQYEMW